ncbi:hypothetical protein DPMN_115604 [Dreissena polymorpha]|uniref:Uncharacterized protein n=1 Tax=Dreissena polymorpha TaxID=45954 RepID=A0A9D4QSM2_DREPO|nr:hypothetical protein DPMN_115604 [Dreissena polymorpha]
MSDYIEYPNFNLILEDNYFEPELNERIRNSKDVIKISFEDFQAKFGFDAIVLFDFDDELKLLATDNLASKNIPVNGNQNMDFIWQEIITDQENKDEARKNIGKNAKIYSKKTVK